MDDEQATRIDIARDAAHEDEVARAETGRSRRDARREPQIPADDPPRFIAGARIAAGRTQPDFGAAGMGGQRRLQPTGQSGIDAPLSEQNLYAIPFDRSPLPRPIGRPGGMDGTRTAHRVQPPAPHRATPAGRA